ncbi:MAG: hypothetical protein M1338_00550 [Patescibacteria group bacterium]|nr:hypothetical protein [Patescibacteria group bacterium]
MNCSVGVGVGVAVAVDCGVVVDTVGVGVIVTMGVGEAVGVRLWPFWPAISMRSALTIKRFKLVPTGTQVIKETMGLPTGSNTPTSSGLTTIFS